MSVLGILNNELHSIGIPYEFMRWTSSVDGVYVVGEYSESPVVTEDGHKESALILTATTRTTWLELEQIRVKIERYFPAICGKEFTTEDGVMIVFYGNSFPVETGEADLKRIQINLEIKEWRVIQ